MYFLQAKVVETSTTVILNYGAVGALLVMCIIALIYMSRFFIRQSEKQALSTSVQISALQLQLNKYIEEDRKLMLDVITHNTLAFKTISEVVEDFRKELHNLNKK